MDALIQAMSIPELEKFKEQYKTNESIVKIVDGYIETKVREEAQAKAKADFAKAIEKLIGKLPHPDDVHNVYLRWAEIEVEDTSVEPEMVDVVIAPAEVDKDGSILTEAITESQPRYPTTKQWMWVVELNKGFQVSKGTPQPATSKRAISVHKRDGLTLQFVGNYQSASKACEHLNIAIGGDSATRVLAREGYILDPYTGTDFTTS